MQIDVEDAILNYEISGDSSNPALLLWHGAGCSLRMWDTALNSLKDRFFCIAFDVRGAGQSIAGIEPPDQFTFEQYSKDINAILEEVEIKAFHLWSMAWGTRAAIAYCSLNPEKVISAVFCDASIVQSRMSYCNACEHYTSLKICKACKCFIPLKAKLRRTKCPLGKWEKIDGYDEKRNGLVKSKSL